MIKLIASDMDGTFLDEKHAYDKARFSRLLDQLEEQGILFVAASGRSLITLEELFADFLDRIALVAENGAIVLYKGELIAESLMPADQYLAIATQLEAMPHCRGYMLSGRHGAYAPQTASESFLEGASNFYVNIVQADLHEVEDEIFKLTASFTEESIEEDTALLSQLFEGIKAVTTGFDGMDIILEEVNKATGLVALCQHLGVKAEQVMAFGDNGNDMEMLQFAGAAFATENAKDEVKDVSDQVIGHCKDEAVQTFLEEWIRENGN